MSLAQVDAWRTDRGAWCSFLGWRGGEVHGETGQEKDPRRGDGGPWGALDGHSVAFVRAAGSGGRGEGMKGMGRPPRGDGKLAKASRRAFK